MTDITQIPLLFGDLYHDLFRIALCLILPLFALSIIDENITAVEGEANYLKVFVRFGLILSLLLIYNKFFTTIAEGMQMISETILSKSDLFNTLKQVFEQVPKAKSWNFFTFAKINIMSVLTMLSYVSAFLAVKLFFLARFVILALLYVMGPVLAVFGIYKRTAGGLFGWLKSLFHVSAWAVVISLLVRLISILNNQAAIHFDDTNILVVMALNLFLTLLFILTPFITSSLLSGGSLGGTASAMIGLATAGGLRLLKNVQAASRHTNPFNRMKQK